VESDTGDHLPHRAALKRVEVRGERDNRFFVRGDLQVGDQVADQGAFKLKDGILVRIQSVATRG